MTTTATETAVARPQNAPNARNPDVSRPDKRPVTIPIDEAGMALRAAWVTYLGLALIPPAAMIGTIFFLLFTAQGVVSDQSQHASAWFGTAWLVGGMTFLGLTLPASFYMRRRLWIDFYQGRVVRPAKYLSGWLWVWVPLVAGGVLGFVGLALTKDFGTVFISMLAFIVFLAMTPNGTALTRPVGDTDDPGTYEEPK